MKMNPVAIKILFLAFFIVVVQCPIGVRFVGDYDEILDNSVIELQKNTSVFLASLKDNINYETGSYARNKDFYNNTSGVLGIFLNRSEISEEGAKKSTLTDHFKNLKVLYNELEIQHKQGLSTEIIDSMQQSFDQAFRAITKYLLFLKWNRKQS